MPGKIIALCGKGGVGKTSISALVVRHLKETYPDKKILAIDADPAIGLATALGVEISSTVDDIRKSFIENVKSGETKAAIEMLSEAKYRMYDALTDFDNVSFLAIGRPESAGCYCKVNAYLKEVISRIADNFDYIVIDGEAGIEQVNRRVMEKVTHLILVTDGSKKGFNVVKTIHEVAKNLTMFETSGIIVNRLIDMGYKDQLDGGDIPILTYIEEDRNMSLSDMKGDSIFELSEESPIYLKTKAALKALGIIN